MILIDLLQYQARTLCSQERRYPTQRNMYLNSLLSSWLKSLKLMQVIFLRSRPNKLLWSVKCKGLLKVQMRRKQNKVHVAVSKQKAGFYHPKIFGKERLNHRSVTLRNRHHNLWPKTIRHVQFSENPTRYNSKYNLECRSSIKMPQASIYTVYNIHPPIRR